MIPVRFSEKAVARYESVLLQVCTNWPNPVLVDPKPLSVETFRCRFRDAMRGVLEYNQGSEILRAQVKALPEAVVVTEQSGFLRIAPKSAKRVEDRHEGQAGLVISGIASLAEATALASPDEAVIRAIALLTATGFLSGAKVAGVTEAFIYSCFEEGYEGGVIENADGSYTIY